MSIRTITKDMAEPERYGAYLITNPDSGIYPCLLIHDDMDNGHTWMGDIGWDTWSKVRYEYEGCTIESLAEHDQRIRSNALNLDDAELRDVCHKILGSTPKVFHTSGLREALSALTEARENES
ncbi:hypothetical protein [Bifidobacterium tibiigranuli]|jgi:hypothetical protein|uniref:hypothetical protein n=1 Tax=Bifidobacterium tibiigranuli TaxID=2172043 RepID=UPI002354CB3B|nr:hypothetical protein [Bifidobacterium tibiigranuli]MCH3975052.1 hypothetical protein [Bifidobacterium tibiigranuli]MCH4202812.1 hypothetical protein [Bifidobacterium tibiigranuli]MCH4274936.1 hypothetical protein [Bifidobacterium tibiigranuli]MCI1211023.1 hypothetical protein [Bifidobacterium tibiigranuli]MCI1221788.1 hypothetical protein [Bifidobacterium tibiigranuli]